MRILVIEDDPNLNNQIKLSLEDSGYSVDVAMDGEEGHFLGDTEPYDAVVLDLGLPKVDGITVLEKWRKDYNGFRPHSVLNYLTPALSAELPEGI